jgi:osmoprotectant transport system permease protein
VGEGAHGMTTTLAILGQFGDAIDFILHERRPEQGAEPVGGAQVLELVWDHLELTLASMAAACAVAVPLGLALGHTGRGEFVATSVSNIGRAVPSFALVAFFFAFLGASFVNVALALTLLAIPPILTNSYVGVRQVDPETVDAARGIGMTEPQIVRRVELPLALPLIFGGVRTSMVNVIATATLAPLVGLSSLGDPIIAVNTYGEGGRLGAAILVALLAVASEVLLGAAQHAATPKGLRLRPEGRAWRSRFLYTKRRVEATP